MPSCIHVNPVDLEYLIHVINESHWPFFSFRSLGYSEGHVFGVPIVNDRTIPFGYVKLCSDELEVLVKIDDQPKNQDGIT